MTWAYIPGPETGCPSALEPVALIWASCLQSRVSIRAVSSSGSNTPDQPSSPRSGQDTSPLPRSGMMSPPLTDGPSVARSTPCLPDTHASLSVKLDSAGAPTTNDTSGPMLPASSAKSSPNGSFSKTSLGTSPSALKPCCESYGKWAGRLRLAFSQRAKQARRMKGCEFSSWPTVQARDVRSGDHAGGVRQMRKAQQGWSQNLNDVAEGQWPTPSAMQDTKGDTVRVSQRIASGKQVALAHIARTFSHPDPETLWHGPTLSQLRRIWLPLRASLIASHGQATWRRLWKGRTKRRLNPLFVEWLMGWPSGHALCACSATEFTLWQRDMRFALSALPTASAPWIWRPPALEAVVSQQMDLFV